MSRHTRRGFFRGLAGSLAAGLAASLVSRLRPPAEPPARAVPSSRQPAPVTPSSNATLASLLNELARLGLIGPDDPPCGHCGQRNTPGKPPGFL